MLINDTDIDVTDPFITIRVVFVSSISLILYEYNRWAARRPSPVGRCQISLQSYFHPITHDLSANRITMLTNSHVQTQK